mmetsp:Transcript_32074/g.62726  ORF Transcript_32074/g.62726 Transcript_32074/m.62726 type:complete len:166 (-) Transcript_32074:136-633(-)
MTGTYAPGVPLGIYAIIMLNPCHIPPTKGHAVQTQQERRESLRTLLPIWPNLRGGGYRAKRRKDAKKQRIRKQSIIRRKILTKKRMRRNKIRVETRGKRKISSSKIDEHATAYANKNKKKSEKLGEPEVIVYPGAGEDSEPETTWKRQSRKRRTGKNKPKRKLPV